MAECSALIPGRCSGILEVSTAISSGPVLLVIFRIMRRLRTLGLLAIMATSIGSLAAQDEGSRRLPAIAFSQSLAAGEATLQIDFAEGRLDLPRSEVIARIQMAAHAVTLYYGRLPVRRIRVLVIPVAGERGVLQGTTWGNVAGFPAFLRLRVGQSTTHEELAADWVITHELVHTALPSLPDDQHWLEEGIASYIEPVARVQAGQLAAATIWADMMNGMPNGEPGSNDHGLDVTHTWGRTYWGGAMFCLMADMEIRKRTGNRRGLQDALRAIVAAGGSIDKEWPLARVLSIGDQATNTKVLEEMYAQWGTTPVSVDLPQLWNQLGIRVAQHGITLDGLAPLAAIRVSITTPDRASL